MLGVFEKHHNQPAQIFLFRVLTPPPKKKGLPVESKPGPSLNPYVSGVMYGLGGAGGTCLGCAGESSDHHCQATFFGVIRRYTFIGATGQLG